MQRELRIVHTKQKSASPGCIGLALPIRTRRGALLVSGTPDCLTSTSGK